MYSHGCLLGKASWLASCRCSSIGTARFKGWLSSAAVCEGARPSFHSAGRFLVSVQCRNAALGSHSCVSQATTLLAQSAIASRHNLNCLDLFLNSKPGPTRRFHSRGAHSFLGFPRLLASPLGELAVPDDLSYCAQFCAQWLF